VTLCLHRPAQRGEKRRRKESVSNQKTTWLLVIRSFWREGFRKRKGRGKRKEGPFLPAKGEKEKANLRRVIPSVTCRKEKRKEESVILPQRGKKGEKAKDLWPLANRR